MRKVQFLVSGIAFGILLSKSEVISWFRIQEMFRFDSIHMYGIIGSAILTGMVGTYFIKKKKIKTIDAQEISIRDKSPGLARYLIGGSVFGLGWALSGTCPGPMFALLGQGAYSIAIVILGAFIGTLLYGWLKPWMPR